MYSYYLMKSTALMDETILVSSDLVGLYPHMPLGEGL